MEIGIQIFVAGKDCFACSNNKHMVKHNFIVFFLIPLTILVSYEAVEGFPLAG